MKKTAMQLTIIIIASYLAGCAGSRKTAVYETPGYSITMPDNFEAETVEGAESCFDGRNQMLVVYKETFEELAVVGLNEVSDIDEYVSLVLRSNGMVQSDLKTRGDYDFITYTAEVNGKDHFFLTTMRKGWDGFYMFTFIGNADDRSSLEESFLEYADTITMKEGQPLEGTAGYLRHTSWYSL